MQQAVPLKVPDFPNKFSSICFIAESDAQNYKICRLKQSIESIKQASYSPFMTLGPFILFHHSTVQPPKFQSLMKTNGKVDSTYPNPQLTINQYYELWTTYLTSLVVQSKVYQATNTLYLVDFVPQSYLSAFSQSEIFQIYELQKDELQKDVNLSDFPSIIQSIYRLQKVKLPKKRKYAAVNMGSKVTAQQRYLPKVHVQALFYGIFYRQQDQWVPFKPTQGDLPTSEELQSFDAVVISGSSYSVYQDIPEINTFMQRLIQAYKNNPKLKILAFCFGQQSIAYALGGKVQAMKQRVTGLENIVFNQEKIKQLNLPCFNKQSRFLSGKQAYYISEYHGDEVTVIPDGFTVIGSSDSCQIQAMASNDGRCLCCQFHMEYTPEFCKGFELRIQSYFQKDNSATIYTGSENLKSSQRNIDSVFELREISRKFLQHEPTKTQFNP